MADPVLLALLTSPSPNGFRLPAALAQNLADHFETLEIEAEVVQTLAAEDFVQAYRALVDAPNDIVLRILTNFANDLGRPRAAAAPAGGGGGAIPPLPHAAAAEAPFRPAIVEPVADTLLARDERAFGMTGKEITALDASIQTMSLVSPEAVEDEKYGGDPSCTAVAIAKRKAKDGSTLPEMIARKDASSIRESFSMLVREYNEQGQTAQVSAITAFKTETDEVYLNDDKGYIDYLARYRRKYRGRAFPIAIDYALVIKGLKAADTSSLRDQISSLTKELTDVKARGKELKTLVDSLKSQMGNLRSNNQGGPAQGDRKVPPSFTCKTCGAVGQHWTNKCPDSVKLEDADDEKDKK